MADSFSREQIEEWREDIEGFGKEPRTDFSKMQAMEALMDTIETALENRSYKEVADRLTKRGLAISESSLKRYVSQYRTEHQTKPVSVTKKRTGKTKKKSHQEKISIQDSSTTAAAIHSPLDSDAETPASVLAKEAATASAKEVVTASAKEAEIASAKEAVTASAKETVDSAAKEAVSQSSNRTSKRLGRSRLSSDENATRYPPGKGEPVQISADL